MGLVILPLVSLEVQVENRMEVVWMKFLNVNKIQPSEIATAIETRKPHMLVANVESLASPAIQRVLSRFPLTFIAVDECQV